MVHEKNSRVSLCVQELFHPQDLSEFLQPFRYVGMIRVSPYLFGILILILFSVWVGLFNNSSDVSEEYGSPRTCLSTLSLDTIAGGDQFPLKVL